jgi:hypothetical protein
MMEETTMAYLKDVFQFPFRGPDWRNRFIVGCALIAASFLIPILPLIFVCGYVLQVMRQAIDGEELTLPVWDDWGRLAIDGLRTMVVGFVYLLPGLLVMFGGMALYFVGVVSAPIAEQAGNEVLFPLLFLGSFLVMFLSMFVGTLLTLLGTIPLPLATAHFAAQDEVPAAFRFREWWGMLRANPLGYFIAWVIAAGLGGVLYLALMLVYYTVVLCCAIPLLVGPVGFYTLLVGAALFGRVYGESVLMLSPGEDSDV